eukprot:gnl/MRDRNA2_/MRDRNA2_48689_c0_seq1.p1 gnl/MRDRNA2_/MRDRNA2_48689_c0~~gnl/MRDRNA2_/MRDRNA2_48689_c0_seq1.p1  ORF type:complete len:488 (+),score=119.51 gnl/MRDRNA2_/MRDRNA2_48689_c0_seq1:213-1466(+)
MTNQQNLKQDQLVNAALSRKVSQSQGLVKLLKEQIQALKDTVSFTHVSHVEIQEAIDAKKAPLELCTWRLERRAGRPPSELKRDNFEIALEQEKQALMNAKQRLQRCAEKTSEMVRSLGRSLKDLEEDLAAKKQALQIDQDCVNAGAGRRVKTAPLQDSTTDILAEAQQPEEVVYSMTHAHREEKRQFDTTVRIQKARKCEQAAKVLKDECALLIKSIAEACTASHANTQKRMAESIEELRGVRKNLQHALEATQHKSSLTATNMSATANAIGKQDGPFNLALTRRKLRQQRNTREKIDDLVSNALDNQAANMQRNMNSLLNRHDAEKATLERLHADRAKLEVDCQDKVKALLIDLDCEKKCLEDCPSYQTQGMHKKFVKEKLASLGVTMPPDRFPSQSAPSAAMYGFKTRRAMTAR